MFVRRTGNIGRYSRIRSETQLCVTSGCVRICNTQQFFVCLVCMYMVDRRISGRQPSWFQTNQWMAFSSVDGILLITARWRYGLTFYRTPDHLAQSGWKWRRLSRPPITITECIHSSAQSAPNFRPKSQNQDPRRRYCPLAVKCRYCKRRSLSASSCKNCQTQRRLEQDKNIIRDIHIQCIRYCMSSYNMMIN